MTLVNSTEKFRLYFRLSRYFDMYSESLKKCPIEAARRSALAFEAGVVAVLGWPDACLL